MSASLPRSAALLIACLAAAPSGAQPGMHRGWDRSGIDRDDWSSSVFEPRAPLRRDDAPDSRAGQVDAEGFLAQDGIGLLGHGPIALGDTAGRWSADDAATVYDDRPPFEAAVIDQLVTAGYDTATPDPAGGQIVELRVLRSELVPAQAKARPVSGEMAVGVSNRGSMVGLAIAVDLRKPRTALVATRLDARVKDRATGKLLWEGHASLASYAGDAQWSDDVIAARLASALFRNFPDRTRDLLVSR